MKERLGNLGVNTAFIEPGSPWENGYVESVNSKLRDELLDGEIFYSLKEAQMLIEGWRRHYNTVRPHSALGWPPPAPEVSIAAAAVRPQPDPSITMATNATVHEDSNWIRHWGLAISPLWAIVECSNDTNLSKSISFDRFIVGDQPANRACA